MSKTGNGQQRSDLFILVGPPETDEDVRDPPYNIYQQRKKKNQAQASLCWDDHCLVLDHADPKDPPLDLDYDKDQQLDLVRSTK